MRQPTIVILLFSLLVLAACQDDAVKLEEHMTRGEAYVEDGKLEEAIIEFKSALQIDPNFADAHYQLAHAFLKNRKPREGFWELRETARLAPDNHEAVLEFSQIAVVAGEAEEAIAQTTRVLQAEPDNAQAFLVRGQAYNYLKKNNEAFEDYLAAMAADPENEGALRAVARTQTRRREIDEAHATFEKLIAAHPTFENYVLMAGVARHVDESSNEEQEKLLRQALEVAEGEQRGQAYSHLTSFYAGERRVPEAYALLEEAMATETDAARLDVIYLLARLHRTEGHRDEAEKLVVQATQAAPDDARTYRVLAAYRVRSQGDLSAALEAIEKALELEPDDRMSQLQKAEILAELGFRGELDGAVDESAAILAKVIAEEPSNSNALLVSAKLKLGAGDIAGATAELRQALDARPNWAQAHHLLGLALAAQEDYAAARVELGRALEIDANHTDAKLILAQVHFKLGEWDYCVEQSRAYLTARPGSNSARLILAQSLVRMNKIKEADEELQKIPEEDRNGEVLFALGRIQQAYGNNEASREYLMAALEEFPTNWEVHQALLMMDRSDGRLDEAEARVAKAVEAAPESAKMQQLAGLVAYNRGDVEGAEGHFRKAIELDPIDLSGYERLARFYAKTGRLEQTTAIYEEALAVKPEEAQIHHFLGVLYELGGDRDRAIQRYEDAVRYGPQLAEAKNNLAYLYADSGRDLDRALDLAQDAKAQLPDNPSVSDTMGWVLLKRGVPSAAISYLKEAERLTKPEDASMAVIRWHLAQAYEANGETNEAVSAADLALDTLKTQRAAAEAAGKQLEEEPEWAGEARAFRERLQTATASSN